MSTIAAFASTFLKASEPLASTISRASRAAGDDAATLIKSARGQLKGLEKLVNQALSGTSDHGFELLTVGGHLDSAKAALKGARELAKSGEKVFNSAYGAEQAIAAARAIVRDL